MKFLVKEMLEKKGININEAAQLSNLPVEVIIRCINNDLSLTIDILEDLAIGLDCRIVDLYESKCK